MSEVTSKSMGNFRAPGILNGEMWRQSVRSLEFEEAKDPPMKAEFQSECIAYCRLYHRYFWPAEIFLKKILILD